MRTLEEIAEAVARRMVICHQPEGQYGPVWAGAQCPEYVYRMFGDRALAEAYANAGVQWAKGWLLEAMTQATTPPGDACDVTWQDIMGHIGDIEDMSWAAQIGDVRDDILACFREALALIEWQKRYIGFLQGGEEAHAYWAGYQQGFQDGTHRQREACAAVADGRVHVMVFGMLTPDQIVNAVRNCPLVEPPP